MRMALLQQHQRTTSAGQLRLSAPRPALQIVQNNNPVESYDQLIHQQRLQQSVSNQDQPPGGIIPNSGQMRLFGQPLLGQLPGQPPSPRVVQHSMGGIQQNTQNIVNYVVPSEEMSQSSRTESQTVDGN